MIILPAIDLRDGKCVRLLQGDYDRQINYGDNPAAQAMAFQQQGAKWLHVVDLDGALHGKMHNRDVIETIVKTTDLKVEVGGGIRQDDVVADLLNAGVTQVVIGTRAMEDLDWFKQLVLRHPGQIVLGLDARDGRIATRGWTETGKMTVAEMAIIVNDWPLAAIVYTDIACDGMLTGPNIESTRTLAESCSVPVIASGGVGKLQDIIDLAPLPIKGTIVGRALYEKKFTLKQALDIAGDQ
ncbi:MAG: 1-(5-phosphoribosyl)-5-[(5-phosphoribosylamino)methylideneamino]imidazole-4-carboxamide isomerase [Phycisphaerae bacterium]|nr:1-(5-phosphoribosyl)-5-[(5-phosphoribosylamino)methylideneamino]imidazole-4-carboxamide isomerase [Phycisphaerae bacterium]